MKELDDLQKQVEENSSTEGSAAQLLGKLGDLLLTNKDNPAKIAAIGNQLKQSNSVLAAAVVANTPAEGGGGTPDTTPGGTGGDGGTTPPAGQRRR